MAASTDIDKQKTQGQFLVTQNRLIFNAMTQQSIIDTAEVENLLGAFLIIETESGTKMAKQTPSSKKA